MLFNPALLQRTLREPLTWAGLVVDLLPIFAVLVWGWGATPLVLLYWFENVIIGVINLPRIALAGWFGKDASPLATLFTLPFFTVHYGMFTAVHGIFLGLLANGGLQGETPNDAEISFETLPQSTSIEGDQMMLYGLILIAFHLAVFIFDYVRKERYRRASAQEEMFAPYGRIVVIHLGIFAGFFAVTALGDPMLGVLALIVLKTLWGLFLSATRTLRDAATPLG